MINEQELADDFVINSDRFLKTAKDLTRHKRVLETNQRKAEELKENVDASIARQQPAITKNRFAGVMVNMPTDCWKNDVKLRRNADPKGENELKR